MSRKPRIHSSTGVYHVMMRGSNKQQIFYEEDDQAHLLQVLEEVKAAVPYHLYAYCLMGNHIHLLIQAESAILPTLFKKIGATYVSWYNRKYERIGHLFQGRFRSEPVEDEHYFLAVLRYILRNPVAAGLCSKPEDYWFSSMLDYTGERNGITETAAALTLSSREELIAFIKQENPDQFLEMPSTVEYRISDKDALALIREEFPGGIPSAINEESFSKSIRNLLCHHISIRQLSRLTGLSRRCLTKYTR